jgi:GNAT superfamily N-acetyltransferase
MITTTLHERVLEEAKKLPFIDQNTVIYEPREDAQMQMFLFYNQGEARGYRAYFGVVEGSGALEIRRMGVHKSCEGQGWGRAIVNFVENLARELGYERVVLKKNKNPSFWKHLGYENNQKRL